MVELVNNSTVKARKNHKCNLCHRTIQKGETYEYNFIVDGGDHWEWKECKERNIHIYTEKGEYIFG